MNDYIIIKNESLLDLAEVKPKGIIDCINWWKGGQFGPINFPGKFRAVQSRIKSYKDFRIILNDEEIKFINDTFKDYKIIPFQDFEKEVQEILLLKDII